MRFLAVVSSLVAFASTAAYSAPDAAKPNVRTITAFVNLDRSRYEAQIDETMKVLGAGLNEGVRSRRLHYKHDKEKPLWSIGPTAASLY